MTEPRESLPEPAAKLRWFDWKIIPAVGAFDLACARLGWHREEVARVTLHGRPLDSLRPHLAPNRRILVLSEDGTTPRRVAALLTELGYGVSRLQVLEHLGGADERRHEARQRWYTKLIRVTRVKIAGS